MWQNVIDWKRVWMLDKLCKNRRPKEENVEQSYQKTWQNWLNRPNFSYSGLPRSSRSHDQHRRRSFTKQGDWPVAERLIYGLSEQHLLKNLKTIKLFILLKEFHMLNNIVICTKTTSFLFFFCVKHFRPCMFAFFLESFQQKWVLSFSNAQIDYAFCRLCVSSPKLEALLTLQISPGFFGDCYIAANTICKLIGRSMS